MRAAKKINLDRKILQELVPLNALSPGRFKDISDKILVEEVKSGRYLFRKGDRDNQSIYLLEGKLNLIDGFRKVASEIESGTDMSRYPVSNTQPRTVSVRAAKKSIIARIDSSLLDAFLTWDQANSAEAVEIGADDDSDWMTRMLQSEAFIKIPPSTIQSMLMKMEPLEVMAGDTVIRQGDEGDYFYTIREGRCAVSHRIATGGDEQVLGEFSVGDSFGEESLVNDTKRNASVTMLTDGVLMRLAKADFVSLLQEPLVKRLGYEAAASMVEEGAVWVDVRAPDEYEIVSFEDSVNIPLATLRDELSELVFNAQYVMCCDTGQRSVSAAFLLSHRGFDVYVLDGGIAGLEVGILGQTCLPAQSPDAAQEYSTETDSQVAEVDESEDGLHLVVDNQPAADEVSATATQENNEEPVTDTEKEAATAELEAVVEALSARNEMLGTDLEQYRSTEARLNEQLELLRGELGESGEKLASLYVQASADNEEKQRLHEENASFQENYAQQLMSMQSELDEARQQQAGFQSQTDAASEQRQQLLDEAAAGQQASQAEILQLQEELAQARSRLQKLENDLAAASQTLPDEHATVLQEQQEQIAGLQEALEQAAREHEQLQNQLVAGDDGKEASENSLRTELQEQSDLSDRLGSELAEMQQQFHEATESLAAAAARSEELETRNTGLDDRVVLLQQELDDSRQQMEHRIEELGSEHLSAVSADDATTAARIQSLEQEIENLQAAQTEADAQLQEQAGHVEGMSAGRQAAEEALQHQQADWEAERARHNEETGVLRQDIEALRSELGAVHEQAAAEKTSFEEQLRSEQSGQLEQYEVRLLELQQDQARQAGELQEMQADRDNWEQKFNTQVEENNQLQQEVASLNDQIATHSESAGEQLQALQSGLETGQQRIAELEQTIVENTAQSAALQEELSGKEDSIREEGQQQELLRQQVDELRQELSERDERARLVEQENQESIRKAHEDLTRKNDNEKELQGQIVRLRKKLEQATLEQQQGREVAQSDIDNIREELHSERQARAEERAELAARQRELKEQLVAVASEHEANMSNQSGAIEEARDAAREEERMHLQSLIKTQHQVEEQLQKVQDELQQAHAEIARLHQQEKDRRQAGSELQQEQNSQAEAAISQLESQLKQLTQERDQSLEEQLVLREKLNVLRGEVEVARGLMNVGQEGQVEDPVRLRSELEETRKNVEISVRLRAEAEAARDQLIRERDTLRELLESREDVELPLHVPSLDEGEAGDSHAGTLQENAPLIVFDKPELTAEEVLVGLPGVEASHKRGWLGGLVVAMIGVSALIFWLILGPEGPGQYSGSDMDAAMEKSAVKDDSPVATVVSPAPIDETAPAAADQPAAAVAVEQPVSVGLPATVVVDNEPVAAQVVKEPATPATQVVPDPAIQKPDVQQPAAAPVPILTAGPVFRDKLKNGRKGPLMVELPGAGYMMGSPGNSLNFDEGPRHRVTLAGFSISKHEVSFAEYDRFARATGRRLPHDEGWGRKDRPAINVSWHDASAYVAWLSKQTGKTYRLPTESEWEYALRAGSSDQYWWGYDTDNVPANCFNCGSEWDGYRTAPVGSFTANNFGLHDMAGNVQEWAQDCYRAGYVDAPVDGSARLTPECTQRAVRGGAYTSPQDTLRSAKRGQYDQDTRLDNLGVRVVREH